MFSVAGLADGGLTHIHTSCGNLLRLTRPILKVVVRQHCWPPDLTLALTAQAVAARYRVAAVQQHCWPPDLTLSLTAPAVAARFQGAAVQQHCWPSDWTLSLAAQAGSGGTLSGHPALH